MMTKRVKHREPPTWIVLVFIGFVVGMGLLVADAWSATKWLVSFDLPTEADSMRIILWQQDGAGDTTLMFDSTTGVITSWDTTWTGLDPSLTYTNKHRIFYFAGSAPSYTLMRWGVDATDTLKIGSLLVHHPDWLIGTGTGTGPHAVTFYVIDSTAAGGIAVQDVILKARNASDVPTGRGETEADGSVTLNLPTGLQTMNARLMGYQIDQVTYSATADDVADTIWCYPLTPSSPSAANLCVVYGYVWDIQGDPIKNAGVYLSMSRVNDTCSGTIIAGFKKETSTSASGYFEQELIYSSCLSNKKYSIIIERSDGATLIKNITVPDSASYQVIW